jgi:hypothetical protein
MIYQLKKLKLSAIFMAFLSGITVTEASPSMSTPAYPGRISGTALGVGLGVKLLNLKNISTKTTSSTPPFTTRSADSFANASSPVVSIYARQYMPDLMVIPTFVGLEFNYITSLHKRHIYALLNFPNNGLNAPDTGFRYKENWDARAMLGAQLWSWAQLDLWAQAGLQLTYFEYEGITTDINNITTRFPMDNRLALAPALGLEVRYSHPGLISDQVVTDFILGWTAGYRNAFTVSGNTPSGNNYNIAMSTNWSHTFGLKVMFRF